MYSGSPSTWAGLPLGICLAQPPVVDIEVSSSTASSQLKRSEERESPDLPGGRENANHTGSGERRQPGKKQGRTQSAADRDCHREITKVQCHVEQNDAKLRTASLAVARLEQKACLLCTQRIGEIQVIDGPLWAGRGCRGPAFGDLFAYLFISSSCLCGWGHPILPGCLLFC